MNKILEDREIVNGILVPIEIDQDNPVLITDDYIEIIFQEKVPEASLLSNLTRYVFEHSGIETNSIKAVI